MSSIILDGARKFLVRYLNDKECSYETYYSWRKSWRFIVYHSLRVESYVMRILKNEEQNLSEGEIENLRIAATLHDIGTIHGREGHAKIGRVIVERWLEDSKLYNEIEDVDNLLYMIETHSDKKNDETNFCSCVLKDADTLDEIGILSIFMAANRVDKNSYLFFDELLDRVRKYEINYCNKEMEGLHTLTAKNILNKKKNFIELFASQLEDELIGGEIMKDLFD